MRGLRGRRDFSSLLSFVDMLSTAFVCVLMLFILSFIQIADPVTAKNGIEFKAEYILTIEWDNSPQADIDVWVFGPTGIVNYQKRESGAVHLDRDAMGPLLNGTLIVNGRTYVQPFQKEVVTWRMIVPGDYTIALHYYSPAASTTPVNVRVSFNRLNPTVTPVYEGVIVLEHGKQEKIVGLWEMMPNGEMIRGVPEPGESLINRNFIQGSNR